MNWPDNIINEKSPFWELYTFDEAGKKVWTPIGSSVFAKYNNLPLIITAQHVVMPFVSKPVYIRQKDKVASLGHHEFFIHPQLDIAIIIPNIQVLNELEDNIFFFDLSTSKRKDFNHVAYKIYGYPNAKNKLKIKTKKYPQKIFSLTLSKSENTPDKYKNNTTSYTFLGEPSKKYFDDNFKEIKTTIPRFEGMSGGGILELGEINNKPYFYLDAVFIEWHPAENIFVGVSMSSLKKWIDDAAEQGKSL